MNAADVLLSAMAEATRPGAVEVPNSLLAAIEAQSDPFHAISDWDACNELFDAIRSQFSFVELVRRGKPPSGEDFDKLTGLLRWIIQEGADWNVSADPSRTRLVALFVVGQFTTMEANFWSTVPDDFRPNDGLLASLERVIEGLTMSFTTKGLAPPIWELEAVEKFEKADAKSDWIGIAQGWRLIEDGFFPSIAIAQTAQCLDRFAPERLVQAISGLRQTAPVMSVVLSLPPMQHYASALDRPTLMSSSQRLTYLCRLGLTASRSVKIPRSLWSKSWKMSRKISRAGLPGCTCSTYFLRDFQNYRRLSVALLLMRTILPFKPTLMRLACTGLVNRPDFQSQNVSGPSGTGP